LNVPDIKGTVYEDAATLERYSRDMSGYHLKPQLVVLPANEENVLNLLEFAQARAIPITPRGAGSNLSGSAVGKGLLLHFRNMTELRGAKDSMASVQPGVVYRDLNERMAAKRLTLR